MATMNVGTLTAIASAIVAIAGTIFTFYGRIRESSDHRLDALLSGFASDNDQMRRRVDELEENREEMRQQLLALKSALNEQGMELFVIRSRESDLRAWARDVMSWTALAVGVIHGLNGTIPDPPAMPRTYTPEHPEEIL